MAPVSEKLDRRARAPRRRRPRLRASDGVTLIEMLVGIGFSAIVMWLGIRAYESIRAQAAAQYLQAAADRENNQLLRDVAKAFRFRVVKVAQGDANKYTFKLTPIAPLVSSATPCYGLTLREARAGAGTIIVARTIFRNECTSALGKPAAFYAPLSTLAKCPDSTPRAVAVIERWPDELDMSGAPETRYQPAGMPPTATNLAGALQTTIASQVCFQPLPTGGPYRSIRAIATTGFIGANGALVHRQADLELPLLEVINPPDDDGSTITIRENGKMEIIR